MSGHVGSFVEVVHGVFSALRMQGDGVGDRPAKAAHAIHRGRDHNHDRTLRHTASAIVGVWSGGVAESVSSARVAGTESRADGTGRAGAGTTTHPAVGARLLGRSVEPFGKVQATRNRNSHCKVKFAQPRKPDRHAVRARSQSGRMRARGPTRVWSGRIALRHLTCRLRHNPVLGTRRSCASPSQRPDHHHGDRHQSPKPHRHHGQSTPCWLVLVSANPDVRSDFNATVKPPGSDSISERGQSHDPRDADRSLSTKADFMYVAIVGSFLRRRRKWSKHSLRPDRKI